MLLYSLVKIIIIIVYYLLIIIFWFMVVGRSLMYTSILHVLTLKSMVRNVRINYLSYSFFQLSV